MEMEQEEIARDGSLGLASAALPGGKVQGFCSFMLRLSRQFPQFFRMPK
jgi:hypothetical protein